MNQDDMTAIARGSVRPGRRKEDATTEERLAWLEQATDLAFRELATEGGRRREDVESLQGRVGILEQQLSGDLDELRHRIAEARSPERMEWAGLALVLAGTVLAPFA